ncbi:MAG TPA: hypothetical protein VK806_10065, partial [Bacteroidia bacterium]|nr:hypothetical protein [Bacteroidia bacterium]
NSNLAANTTNNTQSQENNNTSANNTQNTTNNNTVATNNSTNTQTQSSNNNAQNTPNDTVAANNTTHPRTISSVQYNSNIQSTNSANNTVATTTNNNVPNNTTISITEDIFQESSSSPYSEQHPIPVNPPLPEGLVYKIQVGAFRNPIPQDLFKGIQPIMAETTAQGFKRYTVGLFKEFNGAQGALAKVKGLGYKDAFIVAFYNGKRVPINSVGTQQIASNNNTEPNNNAVNTNNLANNTNPVNNNSQTQANNTAVAPSTSVTDVKGLFYTVQVGAVKDPVPASKLYNLSPLFSYRAANGYLRYNCGIYSTIPKANAAKDAIVAKTPIKDAFVVAYLNGERVGLTQASQSVTNGSATISKDNNLDASPNGANTNTTVPVNNTPSNNTPVNNTPANNTQTNTTPVNNLPPANTAIDTSKVVFSVQVGAYSGEIPLDVANNILKIASQGIHTHKGDDGIVIYTVGSYPDYTNASLFKDELVQDGFPGCFVVAYYHGKKISLQEAQSLMNK